MTTYSTDNDGKFIPASQRPDGTWRKARRVKEGYVPQEEVPLYESKGKQFAARQSDLPVGMCPLVAQASREKREKQQQKQQQKKQNPIPGVIVLPQNSSAKENTSSKSKIKSNQTKQSNKSNTLSKEISKTELLTDDKSDTIEQINEEIIDLELLCEQEDLAKKLKKLKKKIREIEAIEAKIKCGELKKPDKDQLDKVKRKKEFLKEIQELEQESEN